MSYELSEDQKAIQELIRRVAREKVAARADEIDRTAEYPHDMFELLKDLGLFALPFPAEYGGTGSTLSACIAVEELGRVCYNTGYLLVVQWTPFGAILAGGTEAQKQRLLPGLASGELRGALSLTEPQSGSDVSGIKTTARRTADGYVLNGAKIWCTNADIADFILVAAKHPGRARRAARHQPLHRRQGHAGPDHRPQGRQDGRARRAVVPAVLRQRRASAADSRLGPEGERGPAASRWRWRRSTPAGRSSRRAPSASRRARSTTRRSTSRSGAPSATRSATSRACAG